MNLFVQIIKSAHVRELKFSILNLDVKLMRKIKILKFMREYCEGRGGLHFFYLQGNHI